MRLAGGVDQGWNDEHCRSLVASLLPPEAAEFRGLLWEKASRLCHFADDCGVNVLRAYGRGVEQVVEAVLSESDRPLRYTEIAERATQRAERQIDVKRALSAAASVGLLFDRGVYGLLKHLTFNIAALDRLGELAEDLVADGMPDRQWHSAEILYGLIDRGAEINGANKYVLDIALRTRGILEPLGRMVWRQRTLANANAARIDVRQAVIAILQGAGRPLRATEIRQRLTALRGVNQTFQIPQVDPLIRVGPATWGLNDRDILVKRADQPGFAQMLVRMLSERGEGIHITELGVLMEAYPGLASETVIGLANCDGRLKVTSGQYLYLSCWGSAHRETVVEAVRAILTGRSDPIHYNEIVTLAQTRIGRPCERQAISGALQALEANFDGVGYWRLVAEQATEGEALCTIHPRQRFGNGCIPL